MKQCLNKDAKDKILLIIDDYIKCVNDREEYSHHLKEYVPLKTKLLPRRVVDKALNFLKITRENVNQIPICQK